MAVFTALTQEDTEGFLREYDLGEMVSIQGITAGIENSNFFLNTTKGQFVLTIFEVLNHQQLPYYIELMQHLAQNKIPVPMPQKRLDGKLIGTLHGKPASIVTRLEGGYEPAPSAEHCAIAGTTQAQAHLAAQNFTMAQANLRGLNWWQSTIPTIVSFLNPAQLSLIEQALAEQIQVQNSALWQALPAGPAHCDMFRDNVLFAGTFEDPSMGGIIDFYFAGNDKWIFDVAVAVNDWCIDRSSGALIPELAQAWLNSYNRVRPFTEAEKQIWPVALRAAALRFWVSRLYDFFIPRQAQSLKPHDPTHFERILALRSSNNSPITITQ